MDALRDRLQQKWIMVGIAVVIGIALGLLYGWVISPVQWKDATPGLLRPDLRADYLRMAIDSYTVNKDVNLAISRYKALGDAGPETLKEVGANPGEVSPTAIQGFSAVVQIFEGQPAPAGTVGAGTAQATSEVIATGVATVVPAGGGASTASPGSRAAGYILPVCGVTLLLGLLLLGALILRGRMAATTEEETLDEAYDMDVAPPYDGEATVETAGAYTEEAYAEPDAYQVQEPEAQAPMEGLTQEEGAATAETLGTFRTIYNLGDDLYDDSFSVESAAGDFLGECGVGIGDVMGAGEPKKVSAFEVWLFDKNDIQTVTKVLMSSYGFNDEATRAQMAAKGDPVLAENGAVVYLETASLMVEARIVDMSYGQSALPQESFFERMTIEVNAYPKEA